MQTYTKAELYKVMQMECFDIPVAESDPNMFGRLTWSLFLLEGIYKELL